MLVLSRKSGERITLPQYDVVITVLEIKGKRVRLGISAPLEIIVHRAELLGGLRHSIESEGCKP